MKAKIHQTQDPPKKNPWSSSLSFPLCDVWLQNPIHRSGPALSGAANRLYASIPLSVPQMGRRPEWSSRRRQQCPTLGRSVNECRSWHPWRRFYGWSSMRRLVKRNRDTGVHSIVASNSQSINHHEIYALTEWMPWDLIG